MKLIIPLAGKGTRLLPLTKEVPKPLVKVAGRTVLDYVMDAVDGLDIDELIVITGHLKERVEEYITQNVDRPARFVEQEVQDGTAGAVNLARPYVDCPVLIVFVDTIFDADLSLIRKLDADGIIWAKEVEDYQRYGVIVTDQDGYMERIVEKPAEPVSRLANIGVYYMRDWKTLYEGIDWTLGRPPYKGEYFLTDAFQYMIDNGKRIKTAEVSGWHDCGKLETTLATNAHLLESGRAMPIRRPENVTVVEPVRVEDDAVLENCEIGPHVSLGRGSVVKGATVRNAIIGNDCRIEGCTVERSLVGDGAIVEEDLENMIVTREEVAPAP